jgi:carotenoid cleavage dioxygenase-like enzyme
MKKVSNFDQNRRDFLKISFNTLISLIYLNACDQKQDEDLQGYEQMNHEQINNEQIKYADLSPVLSDRFPRSMIEPIDLNEMDLTLDLLLLSGTYPTDLSGQIYFIHPVRDKDSSSSILIGDGVLNVLNFESDHVQLQRDLLKPPCYYLEQLCLATDKAFKPTDLFKSSKVYGKREILNTNIIAFQDHLICVNDAGRPYLIDARSLKVTNPIGTYHDWKSSISEDEINVFNAQPLKSYMTTAHPAYDSTDCFFVNWCMDMPSVHVKGFIHLLKWDGQAKLSRYALKIRDDQQQLQDLKIEMSVHQIALTTDYVVILDTAFRSEIEDIIGISKTAVSPQLDFSMIYLVPRLQMIETDHNQVLEIEVQKLMIPRESSHFFVDAHHLENGNFILYLCHQCASDPSEFITDEDVHPISGQKHDPSLYGMLTATTDVGVFGKYEIDPLQSKVVSSQLLIDDRLYGGPSLYTMSAQESPQMVWLLSFGLWDELRSKRIEEAYADYAYRQIPISDLKQKAASLMRVDLKQFEISDSFLFPSGRFPSTPTFIPKKNAKHQDDGYLLVVVFADDESEKSSGHEIWGFDAQALSQGPLFRLSHPQLKMNFSLHSQYVEQRLNGIQMQIDLFQDYQDRLSKLSAEDRQMFEDAIMMFYDTLS